MNDDRSTPVIINVGRDRPPTVITIKGKCFAATGRTGELRRMVGRGHTFESVYEYAMFSQVSPTGYIVIADHDTVWTDRHGAVVDAPVQQ